MAENMKMWSDWCEAAVTHLLYQAHQELHQEQLRGRTSRKLWAFFPSLFGVKTDKVRSERRPPHQLKESPHQEPLAYPRWTREVELVAEGRSEDEVEHVWWPNSNQSQ